MPSLQPGTGLILLAVMTMAAMVASFVWVLSGHRELERRRQRLGTLVQRYRPEAAPVARKSLLLDQRHVPRAGNLLARLTGIDTARTDIYPMPWQWVLAAGLILGMILGLYLTLGLGMSVLVGLTVAGAVGVLGPRTVLGSFVRRYEQKLLVQLPDALGMIVRGVRSGIPLGASIGSVAQQGPQPTAAEFARLGDDLHMGIDFDRALFQMAERCGLAEYSFFAVAVGLQSQTGGSLTDTLENLSDVIRKRVALQMRAVALASEARTSAAILVAVPFVAAGAITLLNPDYIGTLFADPRGHYILGGAVLMLGMGVLSMRLLLARMLR
ncbi:type II secretion system F family protein [Marinimicrococcus flavescens]|uniref:Type II secretion system F family protein n=1 Tax=Marinimicrococcus flavescens TaxID=3031815 RepID=A0AAP3UZF3_9PROT|nr:type II secretion system F family protein [Marinimicrococcus flavescens]